MKRLKRILVTLFVLAVLVVCSIVPMIIQDLNSEEVTYLDLIPETCEVADEDNAYVCLSNACELLAWPKTNYVIVADFLGNREYDGKPFRYNPSKILSYTYELTGDIVYSVCSTGIVYSVGRDLRDSGGSINANAFVEGRFAKYGQRWSWEDAVYAIDERVTVEKIKKQ